MPIILILAGVIFLVASVRDETQRLGDLLKTQFIGPGSFTAWLMAFGLIALLGTIEQFRPIARALFALLLLVMILVNSQGTNLITLLQMQLLGRSLGGAAAGQIRNSLP